MAGFSKGPATGYSDYYKGKRRTPGGEPEENKDDPVAGIPENKDQRKAAIKRRLQRMKASK